ncbi:MAG TPA: hypothetical protein VFX95_03395, partial [Caulobacteraceae bacterium]|nr:hypothetical protein [Caulobacteraceae bacterium]
MDQDPAWTNHLKPGERLVWQASASPKLRRAAISRRRWMAALIGLVCLALAAAFAWKLYESFLPGPSGQPQPNLGAAIAVPLYAAAALTFAAVFIAQLGRLNPKLTPAV